MKTDYEVEGCWTGLTIKSHCRACGALFVPVPKEGHFNSKYLELQQHPDEQLVCCPNDCSVELGVKKWKKYSKISHYCTSDSESWNYKLDYTIIKNAWIDRTGKVYPVGLREHAGFAYDKDTTEYELEKKGWLKLTHHDFMWERKLSKRQIDVVFDYLVANNCEKQSSDFMENAKQSIGYFKLNI